MSGGKSVSRKGGSNQLNPRWLKKTKAFMEGPYFPLALGGIALLFYVLNAPVLCLAVFVACIAFICFFCEDTRPALAVAFLILLTFRFKDNVEAYTTWYAIAAYVCLGPVVLYSMLYRVLNYRVEWTKRNGLVSVSLFCVAFLIGGVFNEYYNLRNFGYVVAIVATLLGCYAFFAFTMKKREDNLLYLARVCAVFIGVAVLQVLELYLRCYEIGTPLDSEWKGNIILGWALSVMAGEMIVFLMPAVFYLIYKENRGCWYWFLVIFAEFAIYFTFARNALLWSVPVVLVGTGINCFAGRNKTVNRLVVLIIAAFAVSAVFILIEIGVVDKLVVFFNQVQLADSGRFFVWEKHCEFFFESPINGVGFEAYRSTVVGRVSRAHNNLLQMLASTGILGLTLYFIHRAQTIFLVFQKPTLDRIFISGCIWAILGMSLLSSTFFMPYTMVYYSIILLTLEKDVDSPKES